ncbi:MAG: sugar phosphate isomerase/epimerase [Caldimonas sp.]
MPIPSHRSLILAHASMLEVDLPEFVSAAAQAGFDGIGIRLCHGVAEQVAFPLLGDTPLKRETIARLRDGDIFVHDFDFIRLTAETDVPAFEAILDLAAELGARSVVVLGADPDEERLAETYAALCDLCAPRGIRPMLEPIVYTQVKNIMQALVVLKKADRPNAGIQICPLHLFRGGRTAADIALVDPALMPHAQLCDGGVGDLFGNEAIRNETIGDRRLPGQGALDLDAFLAALPPLLTLRVNTPVAALKDRSAAERAKLIHDASVAVLARAD